ncbi:hypothetical protein H072_9977 [Dactylellina haptotyla CBS 200.50]|uniref:Uncharacterized protein n=1 Tax=Dactylellina haptotyla (strain CBS 200.50) TaxID=1284197 RepID=S8A5U4_DACHA|nr:hypothetical protein H072_9977 [Dactylellina haptotyla CBS 200.50]
MQNQLQFHSQQPHNAGNPALLNLLPNSGHQTDLNHLWTQLQELSQILSVNRESAAKLVQKADEFSDKSGMTPGDLDIGLYAHRPHEEPNAETDIQSQNRILRKENATLLAENEDLSTLVNDYESVLEKVLEGLRIFIVSRLDDTQYWYRPAMLRSVGQHEQSISTINIHQSYASKLATERQVNADLRQEAVEFQARLGKLGAALRMVHENENALAPDTLIEELKAENIALREALDLRS